jgi:redox-sensing transcriptional repressor
MRKISESTVRRLSVYVRLLEEFEGQGIGTVSSDQLAIQGHTTPAQVRKDLSFFGSFGKRGLGYDVPELAGRIRDILGLGRSYSVALIGAGKVGSALVHYRGFGDRGFDITAVYDNDQDKIGMSWNGLEVKNVADLEADLRDHPADIAIITTPHTAAQTILDRLVCLGVRAVLNFAPIQLSYPDTVTVQDVNMALELETLSYALRNR